MPVVTTDLSLRTVCCYEGECATIAHIESGIPTVSVYMAHERYSGDARNPTCQCGIRQTCVVGTPFLRLDLDLHPSMEFVSMTDLYAFFPVVVKS